jgi:hypothetical protein
MKYACYGYKFGVEKMDNGDWCAVGRAKGKRPYLLHKIGSRLTEEAMQKVLDWWAKNVGASRVEVVETVPTECKPVELELFPNMQRVNC